jgi:hypothetical protein
MLQLKPISNLSLDPLEPKRLRIVLATIIINVAAVGLLTMAPWSNWRTGLALNLFDNALLLAFVLLHHDGLLARLLLFGLVVGFAELPADAWLVDHTQTLDYAIGGGPMIWRSPIWMPLAWEIVAVQFGYLGLRLQEHFGPFGLAITGALGAVNIPFYEEMARKIHWWQYFNCRMISGTPYYIVVAEFLIAAEFAILVKKFRRGTAAGAMLAGIVAGLAIFLSCVVAFGLTDRLIRHS